MDDIIFYLYEKGQYDEGFIDKVSDTDLNSALEYFKDNFGGEGEFSIQWFDKTLHRKDVEL
jgi:hypothetical protein